MINDLKRYDIVLVDFGNGLQGEQAGIRPAVIIQNDKGNLHSGTTIVMPITSRIKNPNQSTHVLFLKDKEKGLTSDSIVMAECMRQISEKRILKVLGKITKEEEKLKIKHAYAASFGE